MLVRTKSLGQCFSFVNISSDSFDLMCPGNQSGQEDGN
jgi:hypothetical protein